MGKLQEFDITFANNKVVYGPGESISGTVKIRTSESLQFKGKRSLDRIIKSRRGAFSSSASGSAERARRLGVNKLFLRGRGRRGE